MTALGDLRLRCPVCGGAIAWRGATTGCDACGARFRCENGVAVVLPTQLSEHKVQQASFFDGTDAEFEISRPHGTPRIYRNLIDAKFGRSVSEVQGSLRGATVLCVCAGSGMDAEYLVRAGARVIVSDLSPEAVLRACERARRFQFDVSPLVADVEHLPLENDSVDFAYVHDGLHHLEDPFSGLCEMTRVARHGVLLTEPADSLTTRFAVRVRAAKVVEEAGNPVVRLRRAEVERFLAGRGLRVLRSEQYLMYYRHHPGRIEAALSRPGALQFVRVLLALVNTFLGRVGNKLVVQATYD